MARRLQGWAFLGLVAAGLAGTGSARADDAACIAASENEVGLRKQLKLRESMQQLVVCAAPSCPEEIRAECARRLAQVNTEMPMVVLGATDAAGNDLAAVTVTLDGAPFASSLDGRPVQVDPGSHTFHFEAAGKPPVDKTVVVSAGVKDRHVTVVLGASAPPVTAGPAAPAATPAAPAGAPPVEPSEGGGLRMAGYVTGGVGVVGVIVGSVVGGMAMSKSSSAKGECTPTGKSCAGNTSQTAVSDMQSASSLATVSTASFIAGGALLAAGVTMVLVGGPKKPTTGLRWSPTVMAHGGGGLTLSGGW